MADTHQAHHVRYGYIFALLCVFTALSWGADELKQRGLMSNKLLVITVVLAIASAKALFVMMYFMHLKFEGKWKFVLLAPTVILAIGLPLALLPDIGLHYYDNRSPQIQDAEREAERESDAAAPVVEG
jgi:cytochrome c oxidase subunit 4